MENNKYTVEACCVCGGFVTLYSKISAHLNTPWGKFELCYHKACEREDTRKVVANKLEEMALENKWCVYILKLSDNSLYTGMTNNLPERIKTHSEGKGSKYVKSRLPILGVVYKEICETRSEALIREAQIKKMSKQDKENLVDIGTDA